MRGTKDKYDALLSHLFPYLFWCVLIKMDKNGPKHPICNFHHGLSQIHHFYLVTKDFVLSNILRLMSISIDRHRFFIEDNNFDTTKNTRVIDIILLVCENILMSGFEFYILYYYDLIFVKITLISKKNSKNTMFIICLNC